MKPITVMGNYALVSSPIMTFTHRHAASPSLTLDLKKVEHPVHGMDGRLANHHDVSSEDLYRLEL
jgi:hypothetical protein